MNIKQQMPSENFRRHLCFRVKRMERVIYLYKKFWGCKGAKIAVATCGIGMKGEDKALGYTWDYRDYGARNPQAYNDPKLFEEYRRQDKPEYRNLTWLHSGTKDTKIRQEERKKRRICTECCRHPDGLGHPEPESEGKGSGSYSHP